jgi:hypothetical protein
MKIKNSMTDKEVWDEMRSVAFNRDFKKEITIFISALEAVKNDELVKEIEKTFKKLFLIR